MEEELHLKPIQRLKNVELTLTGKLLRYDEEIGLRRRADNESSKVWKTRKTGKNQKFQAALQGG